MSQMLLTVRLSDGRELSVVTDYLGVLARLDFARTLPTFVDFTIEGAK